MAGLLDIFGTSGQETMGLLGMSPEEVQRNRDSIQANKEAISIHEEKIRQLQKYAGK